MRPVLAHWVGFSLSRRSDPAQQKPARNPQKSGIPWWVKLLTRPELLDAVESANGRLPQTSLSARTRLLLLHERSKKMKGLRKYGGQSLR